MIQYFTFKDVSQSLGMRLDPELNVRVGRILTSVASKKGVSPQRLLTPKTNPAAHHTAPHCICHYPMMMFEDAKKEVQRQLAADMNQYTFDL